MACELYEIFKDAILPQGHITIPEEGNTITFKLQEGPLGADNFNGQQIDGLISICADILRHFNKKFPCRENSCAITHLDEAMMWLEKRRRDREARGVEGKNEA